MTEENRVAYEWYEKIESLGFDTVFGLVDLKMHVTDAEDLLERLYLIDTLIANIMAKTEKEG